MEGGTLRAKLEKQRTLMKDEKLYTLYVSFAFWPWVIVLFLSGEAVQWLLDVACALAYLHNSEPLVIHRDLKPENIMLTGMLSFYVQSSLFLSSGQCGQDC